MSATSSTYLSMSKSFQMPAEPPPVPSISRSIIGSDEESFVVLGKSLIADIDDGISLGVEPLGENIIPSTQQLISEELALMDEASLLKKSSTLESQNFEKPQMQESTILPSLPEVEHLIANTTPNDINKTISIVSFAPSELVSEELQIKVSTLIDENIRLKDTIMQNNISMKSQYERIVTWQDEVQKVHETHKAKFLEAKQCIEGLKLENTKLKQDVQVLKQLFNSSLVDEKVTDEKLVEVSEKNIKEFELDVANKKIKELELALQHVNDNNGIDKESVQVQFEEKLLHYEQQLEECYRKIKDLETELAIKSTENVIEKLKVAEESLEEANAKMQIMQTTHDKSVSDLRQDVYILNGKCSELEKIIQLKTTELANTEKDCDEKLSQLKQAKQALEVTVSDLKKQLEEAKIEIWKVKSREPEKIQKNQGVIEACSETVVNHQELIHLKHQLQQSQMALTQYEHGRVEAGIQIENLKSQVEDLKRELRDKQTQADEVFVFKTQAEVFKNDFEAEREAKEALKQEKMKLTEDLHCLHRRNQQLQEEVELLREQSFVHVPTASYPSEPNGTSNWASNSPMTTRYYCPICNMKFRSVRLVQDHLETSACHQ